MEGSPGLKQEKPSSGVCQAQLELAGVQALAALQAGFGRGQEVGPTRLLHLLVPGYNAAMLVVALQSGSNGNCYYLEAGGARLLVDAGISGRQVERRLAQRGLDVRQVDALLISHDHRDHACAMGIYQRKFHLPIYATARTFQMANVMYRLGPIDRLHTFVAGASLRFKRLTVHTVPTSHDCADGVAFVFDDGRTRLGILTDLGHVFPELREILGSLDAVILESNYDPWMLQNGPYPEYLKQRISGPRGHLSNAEAAELLRGAGSRLKWACLAHLSEENNCPKLALRTHRRILGDRLTLCLASRYEATDVLEV